VIGTSRSPFRRRGEDGAALPMALGVLIVCAVVTAIIAQYTSVGTAATVKLKHERDNVYAADGAVDAAIKYIQSDALYQRANYDGSDGNCPLAANGNAFFTANDLNGSTVNVTCVANPTGGAGGATTMSPNFAILTLAPFHGIAPTGGCNNTRDELGLVQVQSDKLLQVHGNVYINSDADSDIWSNGCPQLSSAKHIQVLNGEVLQRESEHDVDNYPNLHNHVLDHNANGDLINNDVGLPDPLSAADAAKLQDPGLGPNAAQWTPNITTAPPTVAVPACPAANAQGYRLVTFSPGTYTDAAALSALMSGGCTNAVFWFQPGNYYFNFSNAGGATAHEWTINDTTTRIVGGQPTAVTTDGQQTPGTWKPTTATSTSSPAFQNPARAQSIDTSTSDVNFTGSGGSASITVGTFVPPTGQTLIPPDATINSVTVHVRHAEGSLTALNTPTLTVTPSSGTCTGLQALTKSPAAGAFIEDQIPVTACLNTAAKINGGLSIKYTVGHSGSTAATDRLDGITLDVSYSTGSRPSWNPADSTTINGSSPAVPGGCRHELDPGWSDGVQWVFGGDSRINLKSGKLELCNQQSTTHQEIVLYGVRGAATPPPVGPTTWTPAAIANGSPGFDASGTNVYTNGRVMNDGLTANANLSTSGARTVTLTQFSPTTWPVPAANQIPAGSTINTVTLQVRHSESSTSSTSGVTAGYSVTPAGAATACTGLPALTTNTSMHTDSVNVTSCLNTPDKLNGLPTNNGVGVTFSVNRLGSTSRTASLDGMQLLVTYTPPASAGGSGLTPESGCITQAPYYNPPGGNDGPDHEPGFNGACALVKVARTGSPDGGSFPRIVAFWGTVYAPSAALDLPVDVLTYPVFNRGAVARMMMLGYNIATDAPAPIATDVLIASLQNRRATLSATAGTSTVVADVEFCDHDFTPCGGTPNGVKIRSWKVTR
jgi:hypothetical protein